MISKKSNSRSLTRQAKSTIPRKPSSNNNKPPSLPRSSLAAVYSKQQRSVPPRVSGSYSKTNIKHRELISSVVGTSAFTVAQTYAINPGIAATFPWLSVQAQGWEQYHFNKLKFCYYTRTGTTSVGSILLAPDYDAADSAPTSEQIASTYRGCVEEAPWVEEFSCTLDPKALQPSGPKYVRSGALASNLDIKTYDGGNFYVCTVDGSSVNWGKLWVEYDVDFVVPQLPASGPALSYSGKVTSLTASSMASIFTTSTITGSISVTVAANTLTFALTGQYILTYSVPGTVITAKPVTSASTATIVATDGTPSGAATYITGYIIFTVTAVNQTVVIDFSSVATTISAGSVARIAPYGSA